MSKRRYKNKSKYHRPHSKCRTGKKRHRDKVDAEITLFKTINYIEKMGTDRKKPKRTYECEFCHGWHLTSKDERKRANGEASIHASVQ